MEKREPGSSRKVRFGSKAEKLQTSICLPLCRQERTSSLRPAHCIHMSDPEAMLFVALVALMAALAVMAAG
jgi:hypothetical protein